jgi:MoaA/NifB/PqqE/SkfB family radical SAM enzyme
MRTASTDREREIRTNLNRMNHLKQQPLGKKIGFGFSRLKGQMTLAAKKPRLGWNILRFWLHHKVSRKPRLRSADIMVTGRCNFKCTHCYAAGWTDKEAVELEVVERAIKELISLGVFHFILQGGEPLTEPERLKAIIRMCRPERSFINVVTNGYLLTPDVIRELKALGVSKIAVSIDSGIAEEHDRFRNQMGSWERAVWGLAEIRRAGLQTGISTTISHVNLHSEGMEKLFAFAVENRYRININAANMSGRWEGCTDVLLTEADTEYLLDRHLKETLDVHSQSLIGRDVFLHHGLVGCPAAKEQVSISATGDVFPCVFLHIALGNIRDQSIRSMVEGILQNPFFRRWNDKCLGAEDKEFIARYVEPYFKQPKPLNGRKVFGIDGLCRGGRYD